MRRVALVVGLLLYAAAATSLLGSVVIDGVLAPPLFVLVALGLFGGTALIGISGRGRPL